MVSVSYVQSISICLQTDAVLAIQKQFVYSLPFKKKERIVHAACSLRCHFIYKYLLQWYLYVHKLKSSNEALTSSISNGLLIELSNYGRLSDIFGAIR